MKSVPRPIEWVFYPGAYLTDESNDDALIEISFGQRHG